MERVFSSALAVSLTRRVRSHSQDGSGRIDAGELKDLMASVGQNPTDEELQ